jgi:uncharacterized protein (TIGR02145 family)
MDMKSISHIPLLSALVVVFLTTFSCKEDVNDTTPPVAAVPVLSTLPIEDLTQTTVTSGGEITDEGDSAITDRGVCWSTNENPTLSDSHTSDGAGVGKFISSVSCLNPDTRYYIRAYAKSNAGVGFGNPVSFTTDIAGVSFNNSQNYGTVTDVEGNNYKTITIGTQTWMAENLKVTKYSDGTQIPNITIDTVWFNLPIGYYCDYKNTPGYSDTYGRLYNWYAVNDGRNIAPAGWHIPTNDEWKTLINSLGGQNAAGFKMTETGTTHWPCPNSATNSSGFTALPGGARTGAAEDFYGIGNQGIWWSATDDTTNQYAAYFHYIINNTSILYDGNGSKSYGLSLRCVKD